MISIVADSSQIAVFDRCPVQWYYHYIEEIGKTKVPIKPSQEIGEDEVKVIEKMNYREMGTCFHHILEYRYTGHRNILKCIDYAFDKCTEAGITWTQNEIDQIVLTAKFYDAHYIINQDFVIRDPRTVEVGFAEEIYRDKEFQLIIEGRIDLADALTHEKSNFTVAVDHKTQGAAHRLYQRSIQFRNYAMVMDKEFLVVNYIRFSKKPNGSTFVRDIIPFSKQEHRAWRVELVEIMLSMAKFVKYAQEIGIENMTGFKRRSECGGSFGNQCQYTDICDCINPNMFVNIKKMNYEHQTPFRPW